MPKIFLGLPKVHFLSNFGKYPNLLCLLRKKSFSANFFKVHGKLQKLFLMQPSLKEPSSSSRMMKKEEETEEKEKIFRCMEATVLKETNGTKPSI